jgi:hypothetical protein
VETSSHLGPYQAVFTYKDIRPLGADRAHIELFELSQRQSCLCAMIGSGAANGARRACLFYRHASPDVRHLWGVSLIITIRKYLLLQEFQIWHQCESDLGASRSLPRREYSNKNMGAPPQRGFCDLARRNVHCLALSARNPTPPLGFQGEADLSRPPSWNMAVHPSGTDPPHGSWNAKMPEFRTEGGGTSK